MASLRSLFTGFAIAMFGIFLLLTVQFRSYLQPLLVLAVIPFGMVGAIWGHFALGLPLTIFTMFGLVALSGVVVNDSIVLIDFINRRRADGHDLHDALMAAGWVLLLISSLYQFYALHLESRKRADEENEFADLAVQTRTDFSIELISS